MVGHQLWGTSSSRSQITVLDMYLSRVLRYTFNSRDSLGRSNTLREVTD